MDDWENLNETLLPEEEDFCSHLNMEVITDANYTQAKRVCEGFEIKHLGEDHDKDVQSDILILADIFENFWNLYLEIYELDPASFLTAPKLAWQEVLRRAKVKLDLLTDIDMPLKIENGIRHRIYQVIHQYLKAT